MDTWILWNVNNKTISANSNALMQICISAIIETSHSICTASVKANCSKLWGWRLLPLLQKVQNKIQNECASIFYEVNSVRQFNILWMRMYFFVVRWLINMTKILFSFFSLHHFFQAARLYVISDNLWVSQFFIWAADSLTEPCENNYLQVLLVLSKLVHSFHSFKKFALTKQQV